MTERGNENNPKITRRDALLGAGSLTLSAAALEAKPLSPNAEKQELDPSRPRRPEEAAAEYERRFALYKRVYARELPRITRNLKTLFSNDDALKLIALVDHYVVTTATHYPHRDAHHVILQPGALDAMLLLILSETEEMNIRERTPRFEMLRANIQSFIAAIQVEAKKQK